MSTWLSTFVQPLLRIPYYKDRMAESIKGFITGSNDQLCGPLEQAIAAVVIMVLAMQTPTAFWANLAPQSHQIGIDAPTNTSTSSSALPNSFSPQSPLESPWRYLKDLLKQYTSSPATFVLTTLLLNVAVLLVPADLKRRLKTSWKLFWQPWKQREVPNSTKAKETTSREKPSQPTESSDRRLRGEASTQKPDGTNEAKKDGPGGENDREKMKNLTDEQKSKLRAVQRERARQAAEGDEEKTGDKVGERSMSKEKGSEAVTTSEKSGNEKLSQSERARKVTEGISIVDKGKGKARMADERPNDATSSPKVSDAEGSGTDPETSGADTDDPLMAGDYGPLKSVLKKSKKQPRQKKNIHHNYYMTMRGWRPSLIPFPHGFHPKPHLPRNTLWWDNVPTNADHIMAPPPVPKAPEKDENEDEGDRTKDAKKGKVVEIKCEDDDKKSKDGEEKSEDKRSEKSEAKSGSSSKSKSDVDKKDPTKPSSEDQAKMEERAKAKAKDEAEAKLKAKQRAEAEVRAKAPTTSKPAPVLVNPQVQKATLVAQGLLCVLLYLVSEQLGFLLFAFFAYQHISRQHANTLDDEPAPTSSQSSSSSQRRTEDASANASRKPDEKSCDQPDEPTNASSSSKRSDSAPSAKFSPPNGPAPETAPEKKPKIPTRLEDLTPEQQERYKLLLEQKRLRDKCGKAANAKGAEDGGGASDRAEMGKGKAKDRTLPKERSLKDGATSKPREAKRYEDLTDDQNAEYLRARAKRKAQETLKGKLGQGSGLSADDKDALSSPPSPTA